jgi:hypothetical protein
VEHFDAQQSGYNVLEFFLVCPKKIQNYRYTCVYENEQQNYSYLYTVTFTVQYDHGGHRLLERAGID